MFSNFILFHFIANDKPSPDTIDKLLRARSECNVKCMNEELSMYLASKPNKFADLIKFTKQLWDKSASDELWGKTDVEMRTSSNVELNIPIVLFDHDPETGFPTQDTRVMFEFNVFDKRQIIQQMKITNYISMLPKDTDKNPQDEKQKDKDQPQNS